MVSTILGEYYLLYLYGSVSEPFASMPLSDTIRTYVYFITELSKMKLAYVQFVRYIDMLDETYAPNTHKRGIPHDVLAVYASLIKPTNAENHLEKDIRGPAMPTPEFDALNPTPTRVFVNGGLTPEEASSLIEINASLDPATFYGPPAGKEIGAGYTDYPTAT